MKKKYCFDIDGVICKTKKNFYHKSTPIKKNICAKITCPINKQT